VPELDIVGVKEIAERLGVKPQTAAAWRHRGLLPPPEGTVGAGVVVRQVSQPFPQPLDNGTTENHVRFQSAGDGHWYQLPHSAYLRGIGAADDTATKLGKALLAATAAVGAIVVLSEAAKQGGPSA
jgi:hypothetical protein